jgi:hypothetical protein
LLFLFILLDALSFTHAQQNIISNGLANRIHLVKAEAAGGDGELLRKEEELIFGFDHLFGEVPGADEGIGRQSDVAADDKEYVRRFFLLPCR